MKLINGHRYLNIGWSSSKATAARGATEAKHDHPRHSVRVIPEMGAPHTVNARRHGFSTYLSEAEILRK